MNEVYGRIMHGIIFLCVFFMIRHEFAYTKMFTLYPLNNNILGNVTEICPVTKRKRGVMVR